MLIDILADGKAMCFGPGYEILNRAKPTPPPPKLVQQIIFNNINYGSHVITGKGADPAVCRDYAADIEPFKSAEYTSNPAYISATIAFVRIIKCTSQTTCCFQLLFTNIALPRVALEHIFHRMTIVAVADWHNTVVFMAMHWTCIKFTYFAMKL